MEEVPVVVDKRDEPLDLPPGFRFHPTDEEIITYYLTNKVLNTSFSAMAIGEADFNKCEPWDMPKKAKMGEKDWYFFFQRDRKYPTGMRTNRATQSGYWKATGKDKEIHRGKTDNLVGMKKTLVFYRGRAPKGVKSNWIMHEFRLEGKFATHNLPKPAKDEWVVSKVFHKNSADVKKTPFSGLLRINSMEDDLLDFSSLPPLVDPPSYNDGCYTTSTPSRYIDNDFKSSNMFKDPSFLINNNQHQIVIKPENHSSYEIPTINQGNFNNQMGIQNMVSDCYFRLGGNNNSNIISGLDHHKQCNNMEQQFSTNQSMVRVSQDTCLSSDTKTDTSSVVSKLDNMGRNNNSTLYEDLEGPSSSGAPQLSDLEFLWEDF